MPDTIFSENDARAHVSASRMPRCYRRLSPLVIGTGALAVNFDDSSDGMIDRVTAGTEVYRSPYPAKIPGYGPTGAFDWINQTTIATPISQASVSTTSGEATATTAAASDESPVIVDAATNTADDEGLTAALRRLIFQNRSKTTIFGASFLANS